MHFDHDLSSIRIKAVLASSTPYPLNPSLSSSDPSSEENHPPIHTLSESHPQSLSEDSNNCLNLRQSSPVDYRPRSPSLPPSTPLPNSSRSRRSSQSPIPRYHPYASREVTAAIVTIFNDINCLHLRLDRLEQPSRIDASIQTDEERPVLPPPIVRTPRPTHEHTSDGIRILDEQRGVVVAYYQRDSGNYISRQWQRLVPTVHLHSEESEPGRIRRIDIRSEE